MFIYISMTIHYRHFRLAIRFVIQDFINFTKDYLINFLIYVLFYLVYYDLPVFSIKVPLFLKLIKILTNTI